MTAARIETQSPLRAANAKRRSLRDRIALAFTRKGRHLGKPNEVQLPDWSPATVRRRIGEALAGRGDIAIQGAWPDREDPRGLYWVRRTGRSTRVEVVSFPDATRCGTCDRWHAAAQAVNRDLAACVVDRGMSPHQARSVVRALRLSLLSTLLTGYMAAIKITGRTTGGGDTRQAIAR